MVLRDTLGDCKPRITPGTGLGIEVVAVDVPFPCPPGGGTFKPPIVQSGTPGPKPGGRHGKIPVPQRVAIQKRLLLGESPRAIAAEYRISHQAVYLISYEAGIRRARQAYRRSATRQRVIDEYRLTPRGRVLAAYANVEPITWTVLGIQQPPIAVRTVDDTVVRAYIPRKPWESFGNSYYHVQIKPRGVAIVALPDGEAFVVEPLTRPSTLYFRADPIRRDLSRSRYRSFRFEVQP